ncbi:MAG: GNAT family N-acetyltransferase, partial [Roseiarcus sp.]
MQGWFDRAEFASSAIPAGNVRIAARNEVAGLSRWRSAFAGERKDRRYYELVEDTLKDGFDYGYFIVDDGKDVCAIQPFFVIDQDLVAGAGDRAKKLLAGVRRLWPRFMRARTLMVGCAAGEGHLDGDESTQLTTAELLARSLRRVAGELNCAMIVLKEFPAKYR